MKNNICIIEPCAGLGNRLLCLYSALYYDYRRVGKVRILWKKEPVCNVKFLELFQEIEGVPITETTQMGYRSIKYLIKSIISKIHEMILKQKYSFYACKDMQSIYAQEGQKAVEDIFEKSHGLFIKETGAFCGREEMESVKNILKPAQYILEQVDKTMQPFAEKDLIGVHIRRLMDHEPIEMWFIELFERKMQELLHENKQIVFYLTSDDEEVIKYFEKKKNLPIFIRPNKNLSRDKSEGIIDAYIDMLCLSRCKKILGSKHSTFSQMASFIGDSELQLIGREDK